jgi:hypothetical protein
VSIACAFFACAIPLTQVQPDSAPPAQAQLKAEISSYEVFGGSGTKASDVCSVVRHRPVITRTWYR